MDSLRHAFTKSRTSSTSSGPPPQLGSKSRESTSDGVVKSAKSTHRASEVVTSKRDSGIGRSVLSSFGSPNGKNHSRNPSGASSRSMERSFVSNGSLNGI